MKNFLIFWLPVFLWASLIFTFSSFPTVTTSELYWQDFLVKKSAHLTEYAILSFLLYRSLLSTGFNRWEARYYAVLLCILYAFSDEFHQSYTPGREPALRDIVFDTVGASLAMAAPKRLRGWVEKLAIN